MTGSSPHPDPSPRRVPWLRSLLVIVYIAAAAAYGVYEYNAERVLTAARAYEAGGKLMTAAVAYDHVVGRYPWSLAASSARDGAFRTEPALLANGLETPMRRRWMNHRLSPYRVDWLPLATCLVAAVLAGVVTWTRFPRRLGVAGLAFVVTLVAGAGVVIQLGNAGIIPIEWETLSSTGILDRAELVYAFALGLALLVVVLTLTPIPRPRADDAVLADTSDDRLSPSGAVAAVRPAS